MESKTINKICNYTFSPTLYDAILLCGGRGTRLRECIGSEMQKALFKVGGKELIRYSIESMSTEVVKKLVFAVDYNEEQVKKWVGKANLPYDIEFSTQVKPGVLNAVKESTERILGDKVIFCNGDEIRLNLDLKKAIRAHESSGLLATVIGAYTDKLYKEAVLEVGANGVIKKARIDDPAYLPKPNQVGLASAGVIIMDKKAVSYFDESYSRNWEGIILPLVKMGQLQVFVDANVVFFNVNTTDQVLSAEAYLRQEARNR